MQSSILSNDYQQSLLQLNTAIIILSGLAHIPHYASEGVFLLLAFLLMLK